MPKLFPGCRARVVHAYSNHDMIGREVRVIQWTIGFNTLFLTEFEGWEIDVIGPGGMNFVAEPFQLSPIIPDGHRAGEEGTCEPLDKLLSEVRHESVE